MKYSIGDIVMAEVHDGYQNTISPVVISGVAINTYYGYTGNHAAVLIHEHSITNEIAGDVIPSFVMFQLFDPTVNINEYFKCLMIHLIKTTNKYDLQILNKCNHMFNLSYVGHYSYVNPKEVLDFLNAKIQNNIAEVTT